MTLTYTFMGNCKLRARAASPQNPAEIVVKGKKPAPCSTTYTTADTIGDWANNIAFGADVIAAGAGVAAIGTSWTGIGGVGFGTIAAGAKFISFAATAVQAAEQYAPGNSSGLRSTAIGAGVGLLVPGLLGAKQAVYGVGKTARDAFVRDAAGISTSQAAQAAACR